VRQALGLIYDFELVNRTVMFGLRKRSYSYFTNSEMAATAAPNRCFCNTASEPASRR
jgi:microcin C transport system substrate-binding protein